MRTMRLALAGATVLALVSASAASVAAQPEQEIGTGPGFAWVASVTETDCWQDGSQTTWGDAGDGHSWFRGLKYGCDLEASDPRVSGTLLGTFGDDCFGETDDTCVFWNTEEIIGPEGAWTGWVWGTHRPEQPGGQSLMTLLKVFTGHGAYEGLTYLLHGVGPFGGELDFNGIVYEGFAPPPLGELPFAMPSEESLTEDELIEAEPAEEPSEEGAATEDTAVEEPAIADEEEADAAAGEGDEDVAVTYVTGTVTDSVWDNSQVWWSSEGGIDQGHDMRITETYEWSDPRLPAVKRSVLNFNEYPGGEAGLGFLGLTTSRLEDSVGAWTGGARTMQYVDGRAVGWDVYVGEGAYEGLIAVLQCTSESCEGQIFEGGLPPMPDPVEPTAE